MSGQQQGRGNGSQIFQPLAGDDPATIAGYRIAAKLGAGGMGKVYLSYTPGGRPVAIKVIRPEFGEDAEFRRRFAQEVQSAQRVQGLFTAPVIDADTKGAQPWLATAYVPGPSLADAVAAHGALPVQAVLLLIAGMAEALHVIHGAGIVHRDLKPSNVLLAADGPRVIDFGIAYAADATSLTGSGVTIGTPSFMAPEQAAGRKVTPATDIFALGQVAAYAATGNPAFGEGTSHGVLYRIVHEEPDLSAVPERLKELVTRCLTKDPAGRPSIAEIIELCRTANAETVLRRPEDWLPAPVAADITVRAAAPAPVQTPPPPAAAPTAPGAAYSPTAPASPAPVAQAPATPPPGFGPPHAYRPQQPHHPTQPAGAQGQAYAPTHAQSYPGQPVPAPVNQGPAPRKGTGKRALFIALAAALVFGIAGGGTVYLLNKDDGKQSESGSSPQGGQGKGTGGTPEPDAKPADASDGEAQENTDPEPAEYNGINLTAGYHLTLADEDVRPQEGEDAGYELSYDTGGYLDAEATDGKLVLLDPSQQGSLETCRADTRFTENIGTEKLSKGRQVCVFTGTGHIGLVTVQGFSSEDSPSKYMSLDLTVWRNAAV
ncbi:Serine/threonine protein kinase [Streptomyces sp. LamerLS-316]|uniref:serine/threonine-protein kinase n=1 Tax=unclassified Streptomyces TaxID=2593676 RepID=UPI000823C08E|nr:MULTISPECIES: serine/threonine-protein kinase [unclassified Streptomyces]MYQ39764.1 protein kinase [Streptomyces sp. SID4921]SCK18236.1 Serine/threonine protein kinase [Streptomyces sp. LamerLS-316]